MLQDKRLMRRFNRGDKEALRDIYALYKDDLVSLACALLHDKTAAEDAVHDVFARLVAGRETLKITRRLRPYLLSAVANAARQHHRRQASRAEVSLEAHGSPDFGGDCPPDAGALFGEQQQSLARALAALPYEQREVVLLRHFGDLKFKAIAARQNTNLNTVQGRYRYALEKLRSLLNGELL